MSETAKTGKAIGYIRVSTTEQSQEGLSMGMQRSKIEAYCALHDLELVEIAEDAGISGKNLRGRPGIRGALDRLAAGEAEALVTFKIDRLSRSTKDVLNIVEQFGHEGWALHSIMEKLDTGSAAGRFVLTILAALSQMEREQIGERTRLALQHLRDQGEYVGGVPLGYEDGIDDNGKRTLIPVPGEQETLGVIARMRKKGLTYRTIADHLNDTGTPTKLGGKWHSGTVCYLNRKVIDSSRSADRSRA